MGKAAKFLYLLAGRLKVLGLLDEYSGAAAAYSLRNLSTSTTNVVKVRRSGDDAELDFTASEVSGGTLAAWVVAGGGTEDGFVTTWYDQSGNANNATQATATSQPKIVSSGTLVTENGKAAVDFDGVNDFFLISNQIKPTTDELYFSAVGSATSSANNKTIFAHAYNFGSYYFLVESNTDALYPSKARAAVGSSGVNYLVRSTSDADGVQALITAYYTGTSINVAVNGETVNSVAASGTITYNANDRTAIGAFTNSTGQLAGIWAGSMQEIIFYPTDQSANRTGIEANINDYYNIYP